MIEKFTISASLKHKELIRELINQAKGQGIEALFPNLDSGLNKDELTLDVMRRLTLEHFAAVDQSNVLYVLCPEGYVGRSVTLEIGYAHAKGKHIYFSEPTNDQVLEALSSGVVPTAEIMKLR